MRYVFRKNVTHNVTQIVPDVKNVLKIIVLLQIFRWEMI